MKQLLQFRLRELEFWKGIRQSDLKKLEKSYKTGQFLCQTAHRRIGRLTMVIICSPQIIIPTLIVDWRGNIPAVVCGTMKFIEQTLQSNNFR